MSSSVAEAVTHCLSDDVSSAVVDALGARLQAALERNGQCELVLKLVEDRNAILERKIDLLERQLQTATNGSKVARAHTGRKGRQS